MYCFLGNRCKTHGGGAKCRVPGCLYKDNGRGLCNKHGGGRKCRIRGCSENVDRFVDFCLNHASCNVSLTYKRQRKQDKIIETSKQSDLDELLKFYVSNCKSLRTEVKKEGRITKLKELKERIEDESNLLIKSLNEKIIIEKRKDKDLEIANIPFNEIEKQRQSQREVIENENNDSFFGILSNTKTTEVDVDVDNICIDLQLQPNSLAFPSLLHTNDMFSLPFSFTPTHKQQRKGFQDEDKENENIKENDETIKREALIKQLAEFSQNILSR